MEKARIEREKERLGKEIRIKAQDLERETLFDLIFSMREQERKIRTKLARKTSPKYPSYLTTFGGDLIKWMRDTEMVIHFLLVEYLNKEEID